jgi:hypothetical protein
MTGTLWDAPNQQVVRGDASPPWQEGDGGSQPAKRRGRPPKSDDEVTTDDDAPTVVKKG